MGLKNDMEAEVAEIFSEAWDVMEARVVPDAEMLMLSNDARHFERATVLYADLSGSTKLVDTYDWQVAGEVYKAYLLCAARLIRHMGGIITAYDGDRIMAVFISGTQTSDAAKCGLHLNWAVRNIINPALKAQYPNTTYVVKQVVGIDTSEIWAARIGVRGGNDLVWIGRAANYAAKLTDCRDDYPTWITEDAFKRLKETSKYSGDPPTLMWKPFTWTAMNNLRVYGSSWSWSLS